MRLPRLAVAFIKLQTMEELPYHKGELAAQELANEGKMALRNARLIINSILPGASRFIENQSFAIITTLDKEKQVWVSIIAGYPGFVKSPEQHTLELHLDKLLSNPADNFKEHLSHHSYLGILLIEPISRRRYRINGPVCVDKKLITLTVEQAYANCPKYIQKREVEAHEPKSYRQDKVEGKELNEELKQWIESADTFFVGSSDDKGKLDASHRGGKQRFVQVVNEQLLKIPDYVGNSLYNTLGNFLVNPNAGLLFIDFKNNRTLQLTGRAEVNWNDEQTDEETGGTNRSWTFSISSWLVMENLKNLEWLFVDYSPFNP